MGMTTTRRRAIAGLGALSAVSTASFGATARKSRRPNIVFILADDMGYADVGCYGRPDVRTPAIDSLAKRGVRQLQAYANSAVCSATRTALITGRYQYRLRVGLEEPIAGDSAGIGMPPEHPTLPSMLKASGYRTALMGKWHLGSLPDFGPLKSGYEEFFGFRGGALDYFSHKGSRDNDDLWRNDEPVKIPGYLTNQLGEHAADFIERSAALDKPFFLSVHFNAPHWPWEGPGDQAESERIGGTGLRDLDGGSNATYAKMIEAMDAEVGRILSALDAHKLREDTIVVFTSDNGGERFADTWPFSGQKTELLEGGLRVPSIISWPNGLPQGTTNNQVSITMDWVATLLSAAGVRPDEKYPLDGMDLLPSLRGGTDVKRTLYWRYKANHQRAVRDGDLKFLKIADNTYLFDVVNDPLERANLKQRRPEDFARLAGMWQDWNKTMLPELDSTFTEGVQAKDQADHIGAGPAIKTADPGN